MSVKSAGADWESLDHKIMFGGEQIGKIYAGDTLIYPSKDVKEIGKKSNVWANFTYVSMDITTHIEWYSIKGHGDITGTGITKSIENNSHMNLSGPALYSLDSFLNTTISRYRSLQFSDFYVTKHIDILINGHYDLIEDNNDYTINDSYDMFINNGVLSDSVAAIDFTPVHFNVYRRLNGLALAPATWSDDAVVEFPKARDNPFDWNSEDIPIFFMPRNERAPYWALIHLFDVPRLNFQHTGEIYNTAETRLKSLELKLVNEVGTYNNGSVIKVSNQDNQVRAAADIKYDASETISSLFDNHIIDIEPMTYRYDKIARSPIYSDYGDIPSVSYKCSLFGKNDQLYDDASHIVFALNRNNLNYDDARAYGLDLERASQLVSWAKEYYNVDLFTNKCDAYLNGANFFSFINKMIDEHGEGSFAYDSSTNNIMNEYARTTGGGPRFSRDEDPGTYDALSSNGMFDDYRHGAGANSFPIECSWDSRGVGDRSFSRICAIFSEYNKATHEPGISITEYYDMYYNMFSNKILIPMSDKWTIVKGGLAYRYGITTPYRRESTLKYKTEKITKYL